MSDTRVSVLTPAGTGAIATVAVTGPAAWAAARRLFRPAGKAPLPEMPEPHRFWFGTLGDGAGDEVVLAATADGVEVHCHGGRRVVRWVVEQFRSQESGVRSQEDTLTPVLLTSDSCSLTPGPSPARLLPFAPTLRTASILLDQHHGAFDRAVREILAQLESDHPEGAAEPLAELARFAPVSRHLVEPWKVVIAGPPNVGKSSLVNALAGYQRSVVSETAGTTRDVVTVPVAFDGWPVELADTAGLRDAAGLEAEGIDRARRVLAEADYVVWVMDATAPAPVFPDPETEAAAGLPMPRWLLAVNKIDQPAGWDLAAAAFSEHTSAISGDGIPRLISRIVFCLVPHAPPPGAAVPYTPQLADAVEAAHAARVAGQPGEAAALLRAALPPT